MPGVMSMTPGKATALAARASGRGRAGAASRSRIDRAVLDEEVAIALAAVDHLRGAGPARGARARIGLGASAAGARRRPARACREVATNSGFLVALRPACAVSSSTTSKRTCRPARAGPSFQRSAWITTNGQTKPPREGPSGPEDDRHVAGEVDGADGVGVVMDVRGVQAGLAAVAPRPARAWVRSGARRCGWSCSAPSSGRREHGSMSAAVKKSGAPCGP